MNISRTVVVSTAEEMCNLMCGRPEEHEYCLRCGRKLKSIEARVLGYGPVCYKKSITDKTTKNRLF